MQKYEVFYSRFFLLSSYAENHLSPGRYLHSRGAAELACDLCLKFGAAADKGFIAGLLHDIAREMEPNALLNLALQDNSPVTNLETAYPVLLHARAAVILIQRELGINDKEVHQAILDHIAGRAGMGLLSKIIFIADLLEPSRKFIDKTERRNILRQNMDNLLLYVTKKILYYNEIDGKVNITGTIELYNEVKERIEKGHEKG